MLYLLIMLVWAVLSWFPVQPGTPVSKLQRWLRVAVEPAVAPFRKVIPPLGAFDVSFIVAFILIYLVTSLALSRVVV
ncbi:MAG: YggT family protein [Acidimicrobiales bacterium]